MGGRGIPRTAYRAFYRATALFYRATALFYRATALFYRATALFYRATALFYRATALSYRATALFTALCTALYVCTALFGFSFGWPLTIALYLQLSLIHISEPTRPY